MALSHRSHPTIPGIATHPMIGRGDDLFGNRAISFHGTRFDDSQTEFIYLNQHKMARCWIDGNGGPGSFDDTVNFGAVSIDAQGYPDDLPTGYTYITSFFNASDYPSEILGATWVLRWTGDWDVTFANATITQAKTTTGGVNTLKFKINTANNTSLRWVNNTVSRLGNIEMVREEDLAAYDAGQRYHSTFLDVVRRATSWRWLLTMRIEDAEVYEYDELHPRGYVSYNSRLKWPGIPIEDVCEISGICQTTPHVCMPQLFSDAGLAAWGALIDTWLPANMSIFVQRGNEAWNSSYDALRWNVWGATREWGTQITGVTTVPNSPSAGKTTVTCDSTAALIVNGPFVTGNDILNDPNYGTGVVESITNATTFVVGALLPSITTPTDDAFAAEFYYNHEWHSRRALEMLTVLEANTSRDVIRVLDSWDGGSGALTTALDCTIWETSDPGGFVDPRGFFEAIAVNSYYATRFIQETDPGDPWPVIQALIASGSPQDIADAEALLFAEMTERGKLYGIFALLDDLQVVRGVVPSNMDLIAYEGGSHVNHGPFGGVAVPSDPEKVFFSNYHIGPYGAAELEIYYRAMSTVMDHPPRWFRAIGKHVLSGPNATGSWTLLRHNWDSTIRATKAFDLARTEPVFWAGDTLYQALDLPDISVDQYADIDGLIDPREGFTVAQYDPTATWSATGLPAGISINSSTGEITGSASSFGVSNVTISVTKGVQTISQDITLTVNEVVLPQVIQDAEVINSTALLSTYTGSPITFTAGTNRLACLVVTALGNFAGGDRTPAPGAVTINGVALAVAATRMNTTNAEFCGIYYLPEASIANGIPQVIFPDVMRSCIVQLVVIDTANQSTPIGAVNNGSGFGTPTIALTTLNAQSLVLSAMSGRVGASGTLLPITLSGGTLIRTGQTGITTAQDNAAASGYSFAPAIATETHAYTAAYGANTALVAVEIRVAP